jgi:hypothetical protein
VFHPTFEGARADFRAFGIEKGTAEVEVNADATMRALFWGGEEEEGREGGREEKR